MKTARWRRRLTSRGWRYEFAIGRTVHGPGLNHEDWRRLADAQRDAPTRFLTEDGRRYWWFRDAIYWENDGLEADEIVAAVRDRERERARAEELGRARSAIGLDREAARRRPIPRSVREAVWERDGARCVECGRDYDLFYDHVIPPALGGADRVENLQLLCAICARAHGALLG